MSSTEERRLTIAGEKWSDSPECASPVIAAFLRSYNDSVSDEVRQTLKPYISRLVGTKASSAVEDRRAMVATDWMIRVHTPAWLRLAGLTAQAAALERLPEITSMECVPSIMEPLKAAQRDADAARAAAWAAARDAARDALKPTVERLQATVPELIERMLAVE